MKAVAQHNHSTTNVNFISNIDQAFHSRLLLGHKVVQIRSIFSPVRGSQHNGAPTELYCYAEDFKFSSDSDHITDDRVFKPASDIDMFVLRRHRHADRARVGDIIPLSSVREIVELVPVYGAAMPRTVHSDNSMEVMEMFYLNNFANKEAFHAILSYQ